MILNSPVKTFENKYLVDRYEIKWIFYVRLECIYIFFLSEY